MALWNELNDLKSSIDEKDYEKEKRKRTIGLFLGPLVFIILELFISPPAELTPIAWSCLSVISWIIIWWIFEPFAMPTTSLLGLLLFPILGILPGKQVLANFGHPAVFMIMGAFILVEALSISGLGNRIALWAITRPWVNSTWRLAVAVSLVTMTLSSVMPNVPVAIFMTGMMLTILKSLDAPFRSKTTSLLLLSVAFPAIAGGVISPIGCTSANFLFIGVSQSVLGACPSFGHWVMLLLPLTLVMYVVMLILFRIFLVDKEDNSTNLSTGRSILLDQYKELGKITKRELYAAGFIVVAIVLWFLPGLAILIWGPEHPTTQLFEHYLGMEKVAMFAALLVLTIPLNWKKREYTLSWKEAAEAVDIGILLYVGFSFTLPIVISETGLLDYITNNLDRLLGGLPIVVVLLLLNIIVNFLAQFGLRMPVISLAVPITASLMIAIGGNPLAGAFAVAMVGIGGVYMIPMSSPVYMMPYSTGMIPMKHFLSIGGIYSLSWIIFMTFVGYPFIAMVL